MYKPLPDELAIGPSKIHGVGILAQVALPAEANLGTTHFPRAGQPHGFIRTPLGGFINHSDRPNCRKVDEGGVLHLITDRVIEAGDELTVRYTLYELSDVESRGLARREKKAL